jgi:hypothetical protein
MSSEADHVLVAFPVGSGGNGFIERLHAIPLGDDLYCLDNSPFYAYDVSFGDIVLAPRNDGDPIYLKTVTHRGHSTYRVRLPNGLDHNHFVANWKQLEALGCTFEGSSANPARLYAIDVPPQADMNAVYEVLEEAERNEIWTFEEGHYCRKSDRPSDAH